MLNLSSIALAINRLIGPQNKGPSLKIGISCRVLKRSKKLKIVYNQKSPRIDGFSHFRWVRNHRPVFVYPEKEPNPHILISGMSGMGKSALFKSILMEINNSNISCIVLDAQNEHVQLVKSLNGKAHEANYTGINLLALDGASVSERIAELVSLFRSIYSLGYIQTTKLSECLWYTYRKAGARNKYEKILQKAPTIKELINELNIFILNSRGTAEKNTLLHLREKLSLLNNSAFTKNFVDLKDLVKGINSFSLSSMKSFEAQSIYIIELLKRLYALMHDYGKERGVNLYIMIDEAQFLINASSTSSNIISKLIEEGRKYGIGLIIVTHAASTLNKQIVANSSTFITFYSREPTEVSYITKILSGNDYFSGEAIRERIRELKQNEAILVSGLIRDPLFIKTPPIFGTVRSVDNNRNMSTIENTTDARIFELTRRPITIKELSKSLNESGSRNRVEELVEIGLLDRTEISWNGEPEVWLMQHNKALSIEHEVYVREISEMLKSNIIKHYILDNSKGPDIVVLHGKQRIAIEYETGLKSLQSTIKMIKSREKNFSSTVIIPSEKAYKFYKEYFTSGNVLVLGISEINKLIETFKNKNLEYT